MHRIGLLLLILCCVKIHAQEQLDSNYLAYIDRYKAIVLQQEEEYGVPAAITMAQALLESGAGLSELATQANNHFGIKCSSEWKWETYSHDDDAQAECFRKYYDPEDSFIDHSLFLKRKRYASLFELDASDYQGWAKGLKQCGYATDPKYPQKLIDLIERYELDKIAGNR
ncbi:MAG: glucosaminidase domain-containing protein [Paludibacteraceae bacterium]|nr:glucosaminidase domain-containing protein [Paludibacteraceae bacterium]